MLTTIIVFLLVLSVLVMVHEFGHFIIGKWAGIGVLEYALGLPFTKPIWSKKLTSGMQLSFYPLLFGGFVKLLGEEGPESVTMTQSPSNPIKGKQFYQAPVWTRVAVVAAGVIMNFFLAVLAFYLFLSLSSFKTILPKLAEYNFLSPHYSAEVVTKVDKDTPAAGAGIKENDIIISADGQTFASRQEFQNYIKSRGGQPVVLELDNLNLSSKRPVTIIPRINPPIGQGAMGVGIGEAILIHYQTPQEKTFSGIFYSVDMLGYNLQVLSHLAVSSIQQRSVTPLAENISGPVGIAGTVGDILKIGGRQSVIGLVNFLGVLSLSLAFMNVLPIPAMDGGRLAFLLIEAVSGKKLAAKNENLINQIGMAFLLALIALISVSDIGKIIGPLIK